MEIMTTRDILRTPNKILPKGLNYNYNTKWVNLEDLHLLISSLEAEWESSDMDTHFNIEELKRHLS